MGERRPPLRGEVNIVAGYVGVPETGKSTLAMLHARSLQKNPGAYVVAHDIGYRLPDKLPVGGKVEIRRFDDAVAAGKALGAGPQAGIVVVDTWEPETVLALAESIPERQWKGQPPGEQRAFPAVLLIDEVAEVPGIKAARLGDEWNRLLARRRHMSVIFLWTTQRASMAHYSLGTLATDLFLFRVVSDKDFKRLDEMMVSEEALAILPTLENHHYVHYKVGRQEQDLTVKTGLCPILSEKAKK